MKYRNELKFAITKIDAEILKRQLALVCKLDSHSVSKDYSYDIRSLYFDDREGSAYQDKINGESYRKKYRIRIYNGQKKNIKLECKHKDLNYTAKEEVNLSYERYLKLVNGEFDRLRIQKGEELLQSFILDSKIYGLVPSVIVDYRRLAFCYPVSDLRITFDENITSGMYDKDIFDWDIKLMDVYDNSFVELEVKYNDFIPEHILGILNSVDKCRMAISKYALAYQLK